MIIKIRFVDWDTNSLLNLLQRFSSLMGVAYGRINIGHTTYCDRAIYLKGDRHC